MLLGGIMNGFTESEKDFKSNDGFNLEDTWTNDIHYAKMLYFCVCIAYSYIISLGVSCIYT